LMDSAAGLTCKTAGLQVLLQEAHCSAQKLSRLVLLRNKGNRCGMKRVTL